MGLDISVYSNINLVKTLDEVKRSYLLESDMDSMYDDYFFIFANPCFLKQADGFETRFYTGILEDSFRAGSYSGYSHFREKLATLSDQVTVNQIWKNPEKYADLPFIDLINFFRL